MDDEMGDLRPATAADAAALVLLRAQMLADMGRDPGDADAPWRRAATTWFADRLRTANISSSAASSSVTWVRPAVVAAFVIDVPGVGLVSSAVGTCQQRPPSPHDLVGASGVISTVSTLPNHRGRGYARRCVTALIDWFATSTPAWLVELHATTVAEPLYRDLGFTEPQNPSLQLPLAPLTGRPLE
jgi:GNAT superfamily N-acetyltransferase